MEDVFRINSQPTDFCSRNVQGSRNAAGFAAIAVKAQRAQVGSGEVYGVPFQDNGRLSRIATTKEGRWGRTLAVCCKDGGLECLKGFVGCSFRGMVTWDCYVDNATGRNGWRKKNGGEFDLMLIISRVEVLGVNGLKCWLRGWEGQLANLLSAVRSTATPASTLPTVREMSMMRLRDQEVGDLQLLVRWSDWIRALTPSAFAHSRT